MGILAQILDKRRKVLYIISQGISLLSCCLPPSLKEMAPALPPPGAIFIFKAAGATPHK
jgi:hypothetical protein